MPKKTRAVKVTDIKANKPWLKKIGISPYKVNTKSLRKTFLIVCEGQSEELYFKSFPVITAHVKPIPLGCSKTSLVECAKAIVAEEEFDEVWCVFDMDYKPDVKNQIEDYNNAINDALGAGFKCAYSNDAFELWYVLHYQYIDQEQLRTFYFDVLSRYWDLNYEKNGKERDFAKAIYQLIKNDTRASQESAINNAETLFTRMESLPYHQQNPITTVYKLVVELNRHLRP